MVIIYAGSNDNSREVRCCGMWLCSYRRGIRVIPCCRGVSWSMARADKGKEWLVPMG